MAHMCKVLNRDFVLFRRLFFKYTDIGNTASIRSKRQERPAIITDTEHKLHQALMSDDEKPTDEEFKKIQEQTKSPSQIFNTVVYSRARQKNYEAFLSKFNKNQEPKPELSVIAESVLNNLENKILKTNEEEIKCENPQDISTYPFAIHTKTNLFLDNRNIVMLKERLKRLSSVHYSQDVEQNEENGDDETIEMFRDSRYGTADPNAPASRIPCGGCGAILHCQDTGVPGYIPSEIFKGATTGELRKLICQRCHFLKDYKVALGVNVPSEQYSELLSEIKKKSHWFIWPGLVDIIGKNRPICVVGNKVDLIPKDRYGYVERIKDNLAKSLRDVGLDNGRNIRHLCLVSAKTGYGIEKLITKLQNSWGMKGDIYLVGCTNAGKSSIFNALIQSDLCKAQAVDIVQRATVSPWPGTTLNLLKFPILSPTGKRLADRTKRLMESSEEEADEAKLRDFQLHKTKDWAYATLMSHVGFTFYNPDVLRNREDNFSMNPSLDPNSDDGGKVFNPNNQEFTDSKWCYDTPGSVQPNQIVDLLTLEELNLTLQKEIIRPKTYAVKPEYTLLLAGLGRIDVKAIDRNQTIRFTVFSSPHLPVSVIPTHTADDFYNKHLGTEILGVPLGGPNRLKDFPALIGKKFELTGVGWRESCADIILSTAGWVSVTCGHSKYEFVAYTPGGKGCIVREPALLPFAVELRGKRIKYTPCYQNDFMPQ
uniref:Uncharacterized protein n=1 Tax=Strigamia maritima TaxID=126957 RepID=T1ISI0_STRMM